jgi:hypothetical protein
MRERIFQAPHLRLAVNANSDKLGRNTTMIISNPKAPWNVLADSVGSDIVTQRWSYPLNFTFGQKIMMPQRPIKPVRSRAGRTMPWPDVLHDFDCFRAANPTFEPMRLLVYDLHACASEDLHATQTMGGNLLVSLDEEPPFDDNVLLVSYNPSKGDFHFEHRTISNNNDSTTVSESEAWSTLRLFVGYKLEFAHPNQDRTRRHIQRRVTSLFEFGLPSPPRMAYTFALKKKAHHDGDSVHRDHRSQLLRRQDVG